MSTVGIVGKVSLLLLGAVMLGAVALDARAEAADDNPVAGLSDARIAFDITAGEPGRLLNILNTIDETREGLV
jgi:hypothetical protein